MRPLASFGPNSLRSRAHCPGLTIYILGKVLLEIFGEYIFRELPSPAAQEEKDTELGLTHGRSLIGTQWILFALLLNMEGPVQKSRHMRRHTKSILKHEGAYGKVLEEVFFQFFSTSMCYGESSKCSQKQWIKKWDTLQFCHPFVSSFQDLLEKGIK